MTFIFLLRTSNGVNGSGRMVEVIARSGATRQSHVDRHAALPPKAGRRDEAYCMKGIILAGGNGTRLNPLTKVTNKHLLPVYDRPMIYYPIQTLVDAGVKDIMIVSGKGHAGHFLELLRSGSEFGARFSYGVQEEAGGIAQALALCEDFSDHEKVIVILGDNILEDNIHIAAQAFERQERGAKIFLHTVEHPQHYGIAVLDGQTLTKIVEKPKDDLGNLAVTGVYMYDNQVWNVVKTLKPSGRGELEITDVNNFYVQQGTMTYDLLNGWWGDGGESVDSLLEAANLVASKRKNERTEEQKNSSSVF